MNDAAPNAAKRIRQFRQILFWPLQIIPPRQADAGVARHWEHLRALAEQSAWREVAGGFSGDAAAFRERYYKEFVTFLPYVQRFLYGESGGTELTGYGGSPIRIFRHAELAAARLTSQADTAPVSLTVQHADLLFFYDVDIMILVLEIVGFDLPLPLAQDILFKFGRAYPAFWEADGRAGQCLQRVEWLSRSGGILAASDYEDREKYLGSVCRQHTPAIAAHWEYLLQPLALHHKAGPERLRYRQIEYHRMPLMAYLALDDPGALSRADFVRLALVTRLGGSDELPYARAALSNFEQQFCYDRFWDPPAGLNTRYLCCGHAFLIVGKAGEPFFTDPETGLLGQFRHQYFLMYLIPHFHKAALHLFSERIVAAISRLDIFQFDSVKQFKRDIRLTRAAFLRFAHRYWFHEVSNQAQARDLFKMFTAHLGTDQLYTDVSEAVREMNEYLDSDDQRRQANTVMRLTVVTTLSVIGAVTTGFLGMNLFDQTSNSPLLKLLIFLLVLLPAALVTLYTVAKSKALAEFLDKVSNERLNWPSKAEALRDIWKKRSRPR